MSRFPDPEHIARAAREIDPVFSNTPQFEAEGLGRRVGARLLLKVETINPIRSFKGRGADFFTRELPVSERRLVTASAGNFGQGLAYAARKRGITCEVFASVTASELKVDQMRSLGAIVHRAGRDLDEAKDSAREHAIRQGIRFVEDGRELAIAEGAGSIAVELGRWPEPLESVVVPLGNGALLGGIGTWIRAHSPATRVIGVCAAGAPSMRDSWIAGRAVASPSVTTIADGIAVRVPIPEALDYLRPVVDDIVLVADDAIRRAMSLVLAETALVTEPAGVVGVAALLEHAGLRTGIVATPLCGANAPLPDQNSDSRPPE